MSQQLHPQTAVALGNLLHKLSGNNKTRQRTLELIKEVEPGYRLPADVQMEQFKAQTKAERDAERRAEAEERNKRKRTSDRKKLAEEYGEDYIKAIEEGPLKKYPHLDYDDAIKLHRADEIPTAVTGSLPERFRQGQIWEFPGDQSFLNNPAKAAQDVAYSMIDGFRAGRGHK